MALGHRIRRHFAVSMVPSLVLVLWSAALLAAGAWTGSPDPALLARRLGTLDLLGVSWILVATLACGLFMHPLQHGMTRLLRGHWGRHPVARALARVRVAHHRARYSSARESFDSANRRLTNEVDALLIFNQKDGPFSRGAEHYEFLRTELLNSEDGAHLGALQGDIEAFDHAVGRYPSPARILPTRLGNAFRREEDQAGRQYGLKATLTAPHFSLVAAERHVEYLEDARGKVNTSIRLCVVSLIATAETFVCLATDGWWLLATLVPYALAYLSYRAAIAAADEFTTAIKVVIDLNRFTLYEKLHVRQPTSTEEERRTNAKLMDLLQGNRANISYEHSPEPTAPPTPPGNP